MSGATRPSGLPGGEPGGRHPINGAEIEVGVRGVGEPILFVPTALTAGELVPIAEHTAIADSFTTIAYHRRGYAGSSAAQPPGSIVRDAADAVGILDLLLVERAHVVSLSFSGAIALEMASRFPARVHTLTLIEPPPVHVPSAASFWAVNARLQETRHRAGVTVALDEFMTWLMGQDWRSVMHGYLPGSVAQMRSDAATFFDIDMAALANWDYPAADAARVGAPVLLVGGTASGTWFAQEREVLTRWLPRTQTTLVPGADHSLALTHAAAIADTLAAFLQRHSIPPA